MARAKIVCTVGPASRDPRVLERMVLAGMDVARLNMSHGEPDEHRAVAAAIRRISEEAGRPVAILLDLSGPKIRLGALPEPVEIETGDDVTLLSDGSAPRGTELPVNYPPLPEELDPGDRLSLADGLISLEVLRSAPGRVVARALSGGRVTSHKGVNLPGGGGALPAMTEKDHRDLRVGLEMGVDWVALSFVRSPRDAEGPRAVMKEVGRSVPILAKIEKLQALGELDGILDAFDGLMVARGDLGVEVPFEDVPGIQKDLVLRANRRAKPVITATQMLLSMVSSPRPTRAEVTDVANAILDGTDAVMLSEETAVGEDPPRVVEVMGRICQKAESLRARSPGGQGEVAIEGVPAAIARATWRVSRDVGAKLVVTPTTSGSTARLVAATRPEVPVLALSSVRETVRALALTWGVVPRHLDPVSTTDALFQAIRETVLEASLARPGDRVVVTAGIPIESAGTTNLLKVLEI